MFERLSNVRWRSCPVKYASAEAFRQALEDRLKQQARDQHVDVNRLRKFVAFDRLLARLKHIYPDGWVLKGALSLQLRYSHLFRTTRDGDLGLWGDLEFTLRMVEAVDLGDFFGFAIESTPALDKLEDVVAVRYRVASTLARRRFEVVTIDVSFGDPPVQPPTMLEGTELLSFAGIERLQIPTLPLEQHIAEKVHAYTRVYEGGRRSSRSKDLVDLIIVQANSSMNAGSLRAAIDHTFAGRENQSVPMSLPPPPADWSRSYREFARETEVPQNLSDGFQLASAFLDPILSDDVSLEANWNPEARSWGTS